MARPRKIRAQGLPRGAVRFRAAALHPLHHGTTGKPKGVLHTSAGYLLQSMWTTQLVFDLRDDDVYWCTADIGWVTGHSYVVTARSPTAPPSSCMKARPTSRAKTAFGKSSTATSHHFLHSPTAIRAFMAWGIEWIEPHD